MSDNVQKSSDELAQHRTELAKLRSELAQNRTLQAAERTYAAWIRTGFTIAGAGWTLGQALHNTENRNTALLIGGAMILLGLLCFVYAWISYKAVFDYVKHTFLDSDKEIYPTKMNLITVTVLSGMLLVIFVLAFSMLLF
ncbi:YidH family protein [Jeotgalibaca sp. A127]|uniref:YidH family protein n=1 Tax=Jeotgalibaca sp. A127 TaxID=3457324 RepID=UPI003FD121C0